ncbi:MAG: homoserine dehydrogenase [Planctomycetota bacterium]|nr:MAG: homoserine dehydrogenase [Planctomycetota bacterium]
MKIRLGLIGLGTVGTGVVKAIQRQKSFFKKSLGFEIEIVKIAVKNTRKKRDVKLPKGVIVNDPMLVCNDPNIDIVVELMGGETVAKKVVLQSLKQGKKVVTANKALLANHAKECFETAGKNDSCIGFEASCAGGIPLIKCLRDGLIANEIIHLYGILNGTCNFILTQMLERDMDFPVILKEAQEMGYAEADPTFDIEGIDTAHKLTILASIAYGVYVDFRNIYIEGITKISIRDLQALDELGYNVKLLALGNFSKKGLDLRVHPVAIPKDHPLSPVSGAYNAVHIRGDIVEDIMLSGPGAGMDPTASAVVGDIVDIILGKINESFHRTSPKQTKVNYIPIDEIKCSFYTRLVVKDHPGVLASISSVLAKNKVSILAIHQQKLSTKNQAEIIITTHKATNKDFYKAINVIKKAGYTVTEPICIRCAQKDSF